ncbi:MAG: hypothetical protein IKR23_05125, partial [Lachnospiraceae bacterium]|nr:hypothetical protein [Lachnospiraceae bacterium]
KEENKEENNVNVQQEDKKEEEAPEVRKMGSLEMPNLQKKENELKEQVEALVKRQEEKQKEEEEKKKKEEEAKEKERKKKSEFLKNMADLSGTYSDHKESILKISGSIKTVYTDVGKELYKQWFGGEESGREKAEKDELGEMLEGVKLEDSKKVENVFDVVEKTFEKVDNVLAKPGEILNRLSAEDFGIVGTIYTYADMGVGYLSQAKEVLDKYLVDSPEMLETVDGVIKNYLGGFISAKGIGEWYEDKIYGNINKAVKFVVDDRIPDNVKNAIKNICDKVGESKDTLELISKYIDPAVGIAVAFKGIYDNAKNLRDLKKNKNEAVEKRTEDQKKIEDTAKKRNKRQNEQVKKQEELNNALLMAANDTTQYIQYRQIMGNVKDVVEKVGNIITTYDKKFTVVGLGVDTAVTILQKGIDCASFIMHCLNDATMLKEWFNGAGRDIAERMEKGKETYEKRSGVKVGPSLEEQLVEKEEEKEAEQLQMLEGQIRKDGKQNVKQYGRSEVKFTRRAMGFESNEELNCYMALNMVHAMLFSASDYNTLESNKMLAKVTMTVLGLEDSIGKTDSDTAMKIYAKLRE